MILASIILSFLLASFIYFWIRIVPLIKVSIRGLHFKHVESFKLWIRLPNIIVDFVADDFCPFSGVSLAGLVLGCKTAIFIQNFRVGFSTSRMKIVIQIDKVSIFAGFHPNNLKPDSFGRNSGVLSVARKLLRLLQVLFTFDIKSAEVRFLALPEHISRINSVYIGCLSLKEISAFKEIDFLSLEPKPSLSVASITSEITEHDVKTLEVLRVCCQNFVQSEGISLKLALTSKSMRVDMNATKLEVNFDLISLLFFSSFGRLNPDRRRGSGRIMVSFRLLVSLNVAFFSLTAHLPNTQEGLHPIDKAKISITHFSLNFILENMDLKYLLTSSSATFGAYFFDCPDIACFTILDRILGRIPDGETEHVLISTEKLSISNSKTLKDQIDYQLFSDDLVAFSIQSLLKGSYNWDYLKSISAQNRSGFDSSSIFSEVVNPLQHLIYSDCDLSSNIIVAKEIKFSIPFEFPLSSLIEHLTLLFKTPLMQIKPGIHPQSFFLFDSRWDLALDCPQVTWSFGDDPFEAKLCHIFEVKQQIYARFERLDRMFLTNLDKKTGLNNFEDIRGDEALQAKYSKFEDAKFKLYQSALSSDSKNNNILEASIEQFHLRFSWDPLHLGNHTIADLLNAMESSSQGYDSEAVRKFSLFIGAFTELSANCLSVYLRDYKDKFIGLDQFAICSPLFLIEEEAYDEACVDVPLIDVGPEQASNLYLSKVIVTESILPVKLFHSIAACLTGSYGFKAAFCPYWDGVFVALDRAFDMLAKQSRETSPRLAIWDKTRLFVHGSYSCITTSSKCTFTFFPGKSVAEQEALIFEMEHGFMLEMKPEKFVLDFDSVDVYLESKSLSILLELLNSSGKNFSPVTLSTDCKRLRVIRFTKTNLQLEIPCTNIDGKAPVSHQSLKTNAHIAEDQIGKFDAFRQFRLKSAHLKLRVSTLATEADQITILNLYDELMNWVRQNLLGFSVYNVRKGILFDSPFIIVIKGAKDSFMSIVDSIHFRFNFDGHFSAILLNFFDATNYGGLHLTSSDTTLIFDYLKSDQAGNGIEKKWTLYYCLLDFKKVSLDILTNNLIATEWVNSFKEDSNTVRLLPESVMSMRCISAPRLLFGLNDEICFLNDPAALEVRKVTLNMYLLEIEHKLAEKGNQPGDMLVLHELKQLIEPKGNELAERHLYFAKDSSIYWHQGLRNVLYNWIDQQFLRHLIRTSKRRKIFEYISGIQFDRSLDSPTSRSVSPPVSKAEMQASSEEIKDFYDKLLQRSSIMYATAENPDEEDGTSSNIIDIRSSNELCRESDGTISLKAVTEIYLHNVKVIMMDISGNSLILDSPYVNVQTGKLQDISILTEDGFIGSRTLVNFENLVLSTAGNDTSKTVEKITEQSSAVFVFNEKFPLYGGSLQLESIGMAKGNSFTVFAPKLELFMSSDQYSLVYEMITKLLVYRDPGQQERAEQLEALALASDLLDKNSVLHTVESLQRRTYSLESHLIEYCHGTNVNQDKFQERLEQLVILQSELALIVGGMNRVKSAKERWEKRQIRLQLDVVVDLIELTMLRSDQSPMIALTLQSIKDTWISDEDFSMNNLLEIGVVLARNKTPGSFYKTLIEPLPQGFYNTGGIGLGYSDQTIRFYWKTLMPVGGIPVVEHAELNIAPLTIQLSHDIAKEASRFFLPKEKKPTAATASKGLTADFEAESLERKESLNRKLSVQTKSRSLSRMESMDEILGMKQRAANHCSFVSVHVPATQCFISYKVKYR